MSVLVVRHSATRADDEEMPTPNDLEAPTGSIAILNSSTCSPLSGGRHLVKDHHPWGECAIPSELKYFS